MSDIYFIGGSPCSGKSTIAEMLVNKYKFQYFKLDDHLDEYIDKGARQEKLALSKLSKMSADEIWLRSPIKQNEEEFQIYREMFEYALEDINKLPRDIPIIAEGAGFLPELMKKQDIRKSNYICVVPSIEFQYEKYAKRSWVSYILRECSEKDLAFENWMERDCLFAQQVSDNATQFGYESLLVDGNQSIEDNFRIVEKTFHFDMIF